MRPLLLAGFFAPSPSYRLEMASPLAFSPYPITPDGRYFVVRGRLVADLMKARREVGQALRAKDEEAQRLAPAGCRCGQAGPGRTRAALVGGWRARLQPAHGAQHTLRPVVRNAGQPGILLIF
jgi:hypothetical protein